MGYTISGKPTEAGEFEVKIISYDDKDASVTSKFMLLVQQAELTIFLYDATASAPKRIRKVANAAIIPLSALSASLNIFVESKAYISRVAFEMIGPVSQIGHTAKLKAVEVATVEGRYLGVDASRWSVEKSTLTVDLTGTAATPGIYLLHLTDAEDTIRVLRIMKSDQN